ncbi:hypothetical protein ACQ4M4_01325 [Leptolyngbya sp. AN02str]|uniref:hypothetical protein n=1 Tax=Leptolyngbya sp. AN02str TaxID=3423363 RepID=UPI003D315C69
MKPELQRIEAMLSQLKQVQDAQASMHDATQGDSGSVPPNAGTLPAKKMLTVPQLDPEQVQPLPAQALAKSLDLPMADPSHAAPRSTTNPTLALGLLRELQTMVLNWQQELQSLMLTIQDLYLEGPVVDGWLESEPIDGDTSPASFLSNADFSHLTRYVQSLYDTLPDTSHHNSVEPSSEAVRAGYRLCGLDADGNLWWHPCPVDQVPQVSLAIARHQKLRQFLSRKQYLEVRLSQLSEALISVHSQLKE